MTPEQEKRGAELFAEGKSERQVANELGIGAGTAHRLRERLAAVPQDTPAGDLADAEAEVQGTVEAVLTDELITALTERHDQLAEVLAEHEARAEASQAAVIDLERQRRQLLATGRDAAPLRSRRATAEADRDDSRIAAEMARDELSAVDAQITNLVTESDLARRQAEAEQRAREAMAEGDELAAVAADQLRGAVLGEVAAGELVRVATRLAELEPVAGKSWTEAILPPPLMGPRDAWRWQVAGLWSAARAGQLTDVHAALAALGGHWEDRDRAELARMKAAAEEQLRQAREDADARLRAARTSGGPMWLPELPGYGAAMPPAHVFLQFDQG